MTDELPTTVAEENAQPLGVPSEGSLEAAQQRKTRLVRFVQVTLYSHVVFTTMISSLTGVFALAALAENGPFSAASAATSGLALYGFAAAAMMAVSALKVGRRAVDAPTWTRVSLITAIPGTLITGALALLVTLFAGAEGAVTIVALGAVTIVAFSAPIALLGVVVLYALVRLLVKNDLDELVWENTEAELLEAFPIEDPDEGGAELGRQL